VYYNCLILMKHNSYKQVKIPSDSWHRLAFIVLLYTLLLFEDSCLMFTPKNLKSHNLREFGVFY